MYIKILRNNFKNLYMLKKNFVLFIIVENKEEFKFLVNNENIIGKLIIIYIIYFYYVVFYILFF